MDTIYACPDKPYDKQIGVYSTALLFGDHIRPLLSVFAMGFVASLAYAGHVNGQGPTYFIVSVGVPATRLLWQLMTTTDFEKDGTKLFKVRVVEFQQRKRSDIGTAGECSCSVCHRWWALRGLSGEGRAVSCIWLYVVLHDQPWHVWRNRS